LSKKLTLTKVAKYWAFYQALAFLVLIPKMSYVIIHKYPDLKKILPIILPIYALLSYGAFKAYRGLKVKETVENSKETIP
jgi:hypothetical protein